MNTKILSNEYAVTIRDEHYAIHNASRHHKSY